MSIDHTYLARLRTLGMVEGTSTLVLFGIAMPLKYFGGMPLAVTVVGSVHGLLFLALVASFIGGVSRVPLPRRLALAGIVAAIVPFGPFILDGRLRRLGAHSNPLPT